MGGKQRGEENQCLRITGVTIAHFLSFTIQKKKTNMFSLLNWVYVRSVKWFSRKLGEIIDVEDCQWGCRFDVQGTHEISIPIDLFHPSCVISALLSTLDFVEVWVACLFYLSGWVEVRAAWLWSRGSDCSEVWAAWLWARDSAWLGLARLVGPRFRN